MDLDYAASGCPRGSSLRYTFCPPISRTASHGPRRWDPPIIGINLELKMYESFYGFTSRPFAAVPLTDRYFPAESIESARGNLIRCVERAEGYGLVMGPTGSGISLLCQLLASHFEQQLETVLLANIRLTNCREMLQNILKHPRRMNSKKGYKRCTFLES